MDARGNNAWLWCICCIAMAADFIRDLVLVSGIEVSYDRRSLIVDGQRKLLFSGSIHYPRSTPEMWPVLISKGKEGGLDVIQTYVFWNLHEPIQGQYDFSGRYDLVKFIKEIQSQGMYVCLRIGPYIESEWSYGGLPFWLHDVPQIVFRSDNVPFKNYMQNFTAKIVNMMKGERLYFSQGGPIILSQIENEYENIEAAFQGRGYSYIRWAAEMAVEFQTGVPWIMCKQSDALDPVINTCNGMRCGETFGGPNSMNKPLLWTENWTSFFQVYGGNPYMRSAQDIAFHVVFFIAKSGSYINYYMYHGGTNFGRKASEYVTTSYYDQAPLDEYGFINQPKWGLLKDLHEAVKECSATLLDGVQTNISLGEFQQAYVFEEEDGERGCVAFLVNNNENSKAVVEFRNKYFELPPKSISIARNCSIVIFNTANVTNSHNQRVVTLVSVLSPYGWKQFREIVPTFSNTSMKSDTLLEQMNTTKDESDYLWYTFRFEQNSSCFSAVIHGESCAHVVHLFVDMKYSGYAHGSHGVKMFAFDIPVSLVAGTHEISLLSVMVGLPDSGPYLESRVSGLTSVRIVCGKEVNYLTNYMWGYQVGLVGEMARIYEMDSSNAAWDGGHEISVGLPLTWYTVGFTSPAGSGPLSLNLTSMGKGEAWVNGQSIGRYWPSFLTPSLIPSQSMYHLPRAFLKESGLNSLVMFEEIGGDPFALSINLVSLSPTPPS